MSAHDFSFRTIDGAPLPLKDFAGKAVLVVDNLRFMRRFDGAPLIQPILFKSAIYWLC